MKKIVIPKEWYLIVSILIFVMCTNYKIIGFGLSNDFFGIAISIGLFFFGSSHTKLKINYLLVFLILVFEFVSYRLQTKSLHFLSIILFVCVVFYQLKKQFSFIAFFCIILFSTVFNKFFDALTTEIKQSLCVLVYKTVGGFLEINKIEGVNFYFKNKIVTIDTACMGLSMFKIGFLVTAVILTLEQKKAKLNYSFWQLIQFTVLITLLNILSNYFRIIMLLFLDCTQENALHHSIGLFCFVVYQVLPMLILIKYIRPKKVLSNEPIAKNSNNMLIYLLSIVIICTSFEMKVKKNNGILQNLAPQYDLKKGKWVNEDVFKIETKNQLIYIKTPTHKPLICWTGAGYRITKSKEIYYKNEKIWYIEMEKNNRKYKSYWWYEADGKKYTSFLEIMFVQLFYNQPIRLINVTVLN